MTECMANARTDEWYLKSAVGLADGWSITKKGVLTTAHHGYFGSVDDIEIRDALAAQLVRQVDALENDLFVYVIDSTVCIQKHRGYHEPATLNCCDGPDRTMNTIKAIVDSDVLEQACTD